ncbi:MAG: hypothetical protein WD555_03210 [Fulvivirga sp.]
MKLLRNVVIVTLILNTLGSTLVVPLIYLDFNLRRDYIARVLCIKKEEPITVCGGKCYLVDQLKKTTKQQQEKATTVNHKLQFSFFSHSVTSIILTPYASHVVISHLSTTDSKHPASYIADIFHPPQA